MPKAWLDGQKPLKLVASMIRMDSWRIRRNYGILRLGSRTLAIFLEGSSHPPTADATNIYNTIRNCEHNAADVSPTGCMSLPYYAEFVDVPRLFAKREKVPFPDLLKKLREKVIQPLERPRVVPTTQSPKDWLLNKHIWKEWAPESVRRNAINNAFPPMADNVEAPSAGQFICTC
uniref:Uncharacterized protein n=1 Tax=Panagrellus redivivus TaxID=6233 RepID=A0A7E4V0I8_PANRE